MEYNKDELKKLLADRDKTFDEDDYALNIVWKKMLSMINSKEDVEKLAADLEKYSKDEYLTITKIYDDIPKQYITRNFLEELKEKNRLYPSSWEKETGDSFELQMIRRFEKLLVERG